MRNSSKLFAAVAAAGLVAVGGTAFTNSNTVAASNAGSGSNTITAYNTTDVQFDANATDPTKLDKVRFTLDQTARYVAIQTHTGGTWFTNGDTRVDASTSSCTSVAGDTAGTYDWTCNVANAGASTPNETVEGANNLTVVATS